MAKSEKMKLFDTWQAALKHFMLNGTNASATMDWPEDLGNHRARVYVADAAPAVSVTIPWRRRDKSPEKKGVAVVESATGRRVKDCIIAKFDRYAGTIAFKAENAGSYDIYYMPYIEKAHPVVYLTLYAPMENTAGVEWLRDTMFAACPLDILIAGIPEAKIAAMESMDEFNRFDSMEVVATEFEVSNFIKANPGAGCFVFPERSVNAVRMNDYLPLRWICEGAKTLFEAKADANEYFVMQAGVYAHKDDVVVRHVSFSGLFSDSGEAMTDIPFTCFNLGGTSNLGEKFAKNYTIKAGQVGSLWMGLDLPEQMKAGIYKGVVEIVFDMQEASKFVVSLTVSGNISTDRGDADLRKHSRLRWLNSNIGLDDFVTPPYTPVQYDNQVGKVLDREVKFSKFSMPMAIKSRGADILTRPFDLVVSTDTGDIRSRASNQDEPELSNSTLSLFSTATNGGIDMELGSKLDYDGYLNLRLKLKFKEAKNVKDIRLDISMKKEIAKYMMGMGVRGGVRPASHDWKWDDRYNNHYVWLGDANGGLQLKLKDNKDYWTLFNVKHEGLPQSWANDGKGGCRIFEQGDAVIFRAYSGDRVMKAGDEIEFRLGILITPVKPIDGNHWNWRYYHDDKTVEQIKDSGANIINVHHSYPSNPYLNYPFLRTREMAAYVSEAHSHGIKTKIYYTVRELTDRTVEMFALRSLDHEIFTPGPGGGQSWLQEHLGGDYTTAWAHKFKYGDVDACLETVGLSRWHNYFFEGLAWLVKHIEIDGVYIDGSTFDREAMRRFRRVMDEVRPGCLIDLHSGDPFEPEYGLTSCANMYMEDYPYIDSLWYGEAFDYNRKPDYWLTEISGIPFGLTGEMLQDQGNAWRGMIYGMHKRYYQGANPRPMWEYWDKFGIMGSEMLGYWDDACPIATDNTEVMATVYMKKDRMLVSIASWADGDASVKLIFKDDKLAARIKSGALKAEAIEAFQTEGVFKIKDAITVPKGKGFLLAAELRASD